MESGYEPDKLHLETNPQKNTYRAVLLIQVVQLQFNFILFEFKLDYCM